MYYVRENDGYIEASHNGGPPVGRTGIWRAISDDYNKAAEYSRIIQQRMAPSQGASGSSSNVSTAGAGIDGLFKLVGILIKLCFKILIFPFYTIPIYFWRRGKIGRICCLIYIGLLVSFFGVLSIGPEVVGGYISSNWIYLSTMVLSLVSTPIISIILRRKSRNYKRNILITIGSGIFVIILTLLIGFFVTKNMTIVPEKNIYSYINVSELNLRSGPSAEDEILFVLKKNTRIQILNTQESGDWVRIKYKNTEGYVNKNYLRDKYYASK